MGELTPELYERCRRTLLDCSELEDHASLQAVFVTSELRPFHPHLPQANNKSERVAQVLAYLVKKQLQDGRTILPLFFQALTLRYDSADAQHHHLNDLAQLTQIALSAAANPDRARLFICYKRDAQPDHDLALHLHKTLTGLGHDVFIDQSLRTGDAWLQTIDEQIKNSDFLLVLLSPASAESEMVQAEIHRAYEYRQAQGKPQTLPIRVNYEGLLPYQIAAFLNRLQHGVWRVEADTPHITQHILAAIAGQASAQPDESLPGVVFVSEDGRPLPHENSLLPPLAAFDPRTLAVPGGVVKLRDRLYVPRQADEQLARQIVKRGSTTTIRAPRQTGKTSLLVRGLRQAREQGAETVLIDLQSLGHEQFASLDVFLREIAALMGDELGLDEADIANTWRATRSAQRNLNTLMEKVILPEFDTNPLVLAFDEADSMLLTDFSSDFFRLLRFWHNRRATHEIWDRLNLVMVIATEPYLLIENVHESPFNVGLRLDLPDFTVEQVQWLNQQHQEPVDSADFAAFMILFHGHPYLTRKALYTMAVDGLTWVELQEEAVQDNGPFGDHLRRHLWGLRQEASLPPALKQVLRSGRCDDETARFRLLRVGLIQGSGDVYTPRCGLYQRYFEEKLMG